MKKLIGFFENLIEDEKNGERLYLVALALFVANMFSETLLFNRWMMIVKLTKYLPLVLIGLKMVFFDRFRVTEFFMVSAAISTSLMIVLHIGGNGGLGMIPMLWTFLVIGARNVDFDSILKTYLVVEISYTIIRMFAVLIDILENVTWPGNIERHGGLGREAFGFTYPTILPAHMFGILAALYYLYRKKLNVFVYIATTLISIYMFLRTRARTGIACLILLNIGFFWMDIRERMKGKSEGRFWREKASHLECLSVPICAVFTFLLTWMYDSGNTFMAKLDDIMSNRLNLGKMALDSYGIPLWGDPVTFVGFGGSLKSLYAEGYNFIDAFYLYGLVKFGLVFMLLFIGVLVYLCYKHRENRALVWVIVVMAIKMTVETHKSEFGTMIFMLAAFAKVTCDPKLWRRSDKENTVISEQ